MRDHGIQNVKQSQDNEDPEGIRAETLFERQTRQKEQRTERIGESHGMRTRKHVRQTNHPNGGHDQEKRPTSIRPAPINSIQAVPRCSRYLMMARAPTRFRRA